MAKTQLWIGSDHAGFPLKQRLIKAHPEFDWHDEGTFSEESVDYPDYASKVATAIKEKLPHAFGVLICGSGEGMVMTANRYPWIRAALCWNEESARLTRAHNNANVLCLAARLVSPDINEKILLTFLSTPFEGGRHQRRVEKM